MQDLPETPDLLVVRQRQKNGFKALIYMHRYQPDTIARIRTDYVHEQQSRYRTAIADMENRIANASTSERVKLNKALTKLKDQDAELRSYEERFIIWQTR